MSVEPVNTIFYGRSRPDDTVNPSTRLAVMVDERPYNVRITTANGVVYYEVDMSLLGCNARTVWHEIYTAIADAARRNRSAVVVCCEFQEIHVDLLDIFYSYMVPPSGPPSGTPLVFHLWTTGVSFIKDRVRLLCRIVVVKGSTSTSPSNHVVICSRIAAAVDAIVSTRSGREAKKKENPYLVLREALYDILVYHVDVGDCVWWLIKDGLPTKKDNVHHTMLFFKYYANYFRPIHHLERFVLRLSEATNKNDTITHQPPTRK